MTLGAVYRVLKGLFTGSRRETVPKPRQRWSLREERLVLALMHNCINPEVKFRTLLTEGGAESLQLARV
jgi:hypothetical protein